MMAKKPQCSGKGVQAKCIRSNSGMKRTTYQLWKRLPSVPLAHLWISVWCWPFLHIHTTPKKGAGGRGERERERKKPIKLGTRVHI